MPEPVFEADFKPCSYGFRPKRRAQDATAEIHYYGTHGYCWALDADIEAFSAQRIVTLAPGQSWNMTFAAPRSLPLGSAQAGLSAMQWIWLSLGGLVLILVVVMGSYALQHRRRQAPA